MKKPFIYLILIAASCAIKVANGPSISDIVKICYAKENYF